MPVIDRLSERQAELYAEPEMRSGVMGELVEHFRNRLLREANLERLTNLPPQILRAKIESLIGAMIREEGRVISYADRARLITFITNETAGYGPLEILLRDPTITEIMVNAPNEVYIERAGRLQRRTDVSFIDEDHIRHIIDRIVSPIGRRIDESSPMVDARLPDGSRVNAIIPPLALNGPTLTIRRFREDPYEVEDLIGFGTLAKDMAEFLRACVIARLNILISGGTGSGKTTTLNVLASFIPHHERVITIEDAAELQFYKTHPHVVRQEARPPNVEGEGEVTIRQLVRNALRMRPNRIVVGEVRGAEALDMLQAMNTGHDGSLTTVHANSPEDAFSRLETMVMWAGTELPSAAIREQLVGALNIIMQQDRMPCWAPTCRLASDLNAWPASRPKASKYRPPCSSPLTRSWRTCARTPTSLRSWLMDRTKSMWSARAKSRSGPTSASVTNTICAATSTPSSSPWAGALTRTLLW
jgi:pilus assembly protein CpaF